ncbi:MAG: tetraacyldisaccharide 4'-kinase, partial [Bacteroidota bacterium]
MQIIRWFLFPVSLLYGLITELRNRCFELGVFGTYVIPVKSICVGNLSVGGTGKTPHVAWLAEQYSDDFKVVILSRGYGRKTKGFRWVDRDASPQDSGDEPLLYARKFHGKVKVAVCERRVQGVQRILNEFPETNLILLDDAFQHR